MVMRRGGVVVWDFQLIFWSGFDVSSRAIGVWILFLWSFAMECVLDSTFGLCWFIGFSLVLEVYFIGV